VWKARAQECLGLLLVAPPRQAAIVSIDGKEPTRQNLTVEPGRHFVEVVGTSKKVGVNGFAAGAAMVNPLVGAGAALGGILVASANAIHSDRLKACFIARPGRTYEVRTFVDGGVWHVEVVDQTTTYDVKSPCKQRP
jgi:hypothetical protein